MIQIQAIPALADNVIWALIDNNYCTVVDPGDAALVLQFLQTHTLTPTAILITHHHADHTAGIASLVEKYHLPVYGPANERIAHCDHPVREPDQIILKELNLSLKVLDVPGHTKGHVAYVGDNILFSGDILFSAGCGKIFEGTPKQMYQSLMKLRNLPDETLIYCAHEYTLNNLRFAETVEQNHSAIQKHKQICQEKIKQHLPTLPSTIRQEKLINPFLRCEEKSVIEAVTRYAKQTPKDEVETFHLLREWKDNF